MTSRSPGYRRRANLPLSSDRNIHAGLIGPRSVFISAPGRLALPAPAKECGDSLQITKLLFNVTIENSLGPVQVMISPENTVADLVKAALAIYDKEKRRPFLKEADPKRYNLHYSPFSLQSLKPNEQLVNLGSRNFFMCSKPGKSSCHEEANVTVESLFPLMMLVHLLL